MNRVKLILLCSSGLLLTACTVMPSGPSVMVMPGSGRSLQSFNADEAWCRGYAYDQIGGRTAEQSAQESTVNSAVVGTAIGAVAGALIGGGGRGAAVGAGAGMAMGAAVGSENARASGYGSQRRYDNAYIQCMYAKGHRVPVPGNMSPPRASRYDEIGAPPPPPGEPPPPPAR